MDPTVSDLAPTRAVRPEDRAAVERLLAASSLILDGVAEAFPDFIVAEAQDAIVGVAGLEVRRDNGLLRSVAVDPAWRGHGIGRALVNRVIAEAERRGLQALYLLTTTAADYYPSFGFRVVARDAVPADVQESVEFRGACPATAVAMCRPLAGGFLPPTPGAGEQNPAS